jgi:hypothetical protein
LYIGRIKKRYGQGQAEGILFPNLPKVKERHLLTGLGMVLTPGIGKTIAKVSDKIRLVKPDKTIIDTAIQAIVFESQDILISGNYTNEDIPVGTEVWLIQ